MKKKPISYIAFSARKGEEAKEIGKASSYTEVLQMAKSYRSSLTAEEKSVTVTFIGIDDEEWLKNARWPQK